MLRGDTPQLLLEGRFTLQAAERAGAEMPTTTPKEAPATFANNPADLGQGKTGRRAWEERGPPAGEQPDVILDVGDLISDGNGEVVLFNDSQFSWLQLTTDAPAIREGTVERHITLAGDDVSGFRFVEFASGLTLYHEASLAVTIVAHSG